MGQGKTLLRKKAAKEIERAQIVVERLALDLHVVFHAWTHWEALNGDNPSSREALREISREFQYDTRALMNVFARDCVIALARMTDQGKDCYSLPMIGKIIRTPQVQSLLLAKAKAWDGRPYDIDQSWTRDNAILCRDKIGMIQSCVPADWKADNDHLKSKKLLTFRDKIRDIRDNAIAHSLDAPVLHAFTIDEFRECLALVHALVNAAHLVFTGKTLPANLVPAQQHMAESFWHFAHIGFAQEKTRLRFLRSAQSPRRLEHSA